jgi:hypothetical protein
VPPSASTTWTRQGGPGVGRHFGQSHKFADGKADIVGAKCVRREDSVLATDKQHMLCYT